MYECYLECAEWERLDLSDLFYEVKNYRVIEISLDNWVAIRQWKDIPMMYETEDKEVFHMEYWMLYCTRWQDIISVWNWRGEEELKEYIDICSEYL